MPESTRCSLRTAASFRPARNLREVLGPIEHRTWRYTQTLTLDAYLDRVASTSFVAAMTNDERHELLNEVRETLAGLEHPFDAGYVTEVFVADRPV